MKIQLPTIKDLSKELTRLKFIEDEYLQEGDHLPSMQITLASDENGFALQTGDNSFSGSAYFYQFWGVGYLYRRTNCKELARQLIEECKELASSSD